jgi:multidrug resistance efflux pump
MMKWLHGVAAVGMLILITAWGVARGDDKKPVLETKGYFVPAQSIALSPSVAGQVVEVKVKEGQRVEKGQELARLDPRPFEIEVERRQAALLRVEAELKRFESGPRPEAVAQAEADVLEAEARLQVADKTFQRLKEVMKANKNAVPEDEVLKAEAQRRIAEAALVRQKAALDLVKAGPAKEQLDAARATAHEAHARLARARLDLDGAVVRAPAAGTVLRLFVSPGDRVDPAGFQVASKVCELADLTQLEVEVFVQERDIRLIEQGQRCLVRPEAYADLTLKGRVDRILPVADRARGAVGVRIRLAGLTVDSKPRPDMGAIVSFLDVGKE